MKRRSQPQALGIFELYLPLYVIMNVVSSRRIPLRAQALLSAQAPDQVSIYGLRVAAANELLEAEGLTFKTFQHQTSLEINLLLVPHRVHGTSTIAVPS